MIAADLCNGGQRESLIENLPVLDGLVNCAGIGKNMPFQFVNAEALAGVMDVNFYAPALMSAELARRNKMAENSSIVFITSISGLMVAAAGNSIYTATKGAITAMANNMAIDLSEKKIRVNCILPGMVETPFIYQGAYTQEQLDSDMKRYPLKRYGKPEEVAHAVIYLLSDASSCVTGSNLVIDGGRSVAY